MATANAKLPMLHFVRPLASPPTSTADVEAYLDPATAASVARAAINMFFSRSRVANVDFNQALDADVDMRVRQQIASWDLGGISAEKYEPLIVTAVQLGSIGYGHTQHSVQIQIALYAFLHLCADDFAVPITALEDFMARLYSGRKQLHPVLDRLVEVLGRMSDFFPPYAVKSIIRSSVDFINSIVFDEQIANMPLKRSALAFVAYRRANSGIGEAFALFVWDKFSFPDVLTHIQTLPEVSILTAHINDFFSFYKEEVKHETGNMIRERAAVTGKPIAVVLAEVVDETVGIIERVRGLLTGQLEKDTWERYLAGYATFHCVTQRYGVQKLLLGEDSR